MRCSTAQQHCPCHVQLVCPLTSIRGVQDLEVRKIIVPTIDTVRYTYLVDIAMQHKQPILLVGPTGTGKSAYMLQYLYAMDTERYATPIIVGFSARTSANMTQYLIDAKLDRRRKGVYGPPAGKEVGDSGCGCSS
mmetsp:Transcript_2160/g.5381  ORF Transcript_2160/g.5381 Transcript_2160/m.5381 type:complete len:135 (+) Transcript_2160:174-578(+)